MPVYKIQDFRKAFYDSAVYANRLSLHIRQHSEAKRMLIHSKYTIKEIALELGYNDSSYFSRYFKKNTGESPLVFLNRYK